MTVLCSIDSVVSSNHTVSVLPIGVGHLLLFSDRASRPHSPIGRSNGVIRFILLVRKLFGNIRYESLSVGARFRFGRTDRGRWENRKIYTSAQVRSVNYRFDFRNRRDSHTLYRDVTRGEGGYGVQPSPSSH